MMFENNLYAEIVTKIRFSEVDSMGIVWHGAYAKYFEDAREEFGNKYDFGYLRIFREGYYSPLVSLDFKYKNPLIYGESVRIEIEYVNTESAKICFNYKIFNTKNNVLSTVGSSVQVFLDKEYRLVYYTPDFYEEWKKKYLFK